MRRQPALDRAHARVAPRLQRRENLPSGTTCESFQQRLDNAWRRARERWIDDMVERSGRTEMQRLATVAEQQEMNREGVRRAWQALKTHANRRAALQLLEQAADEAVIRACTEGAGPQSPQSRQDVYDAERAAVRAAGRLRRNARRLLTEFHAYERTVDAAVRHLDAEQWRQCSRNWAWDEISAAMRALEDVVRQLKHAKATPPVKGSRGRKSWPHLQRAVVEVIDLFRSTGLRTNRAIELAGPLLFGAGVWAPTGPGLRLKYYDLKNRRVDNP